MSWTHATNTTVWFPNPQKTALRDISNCCSTQRETGPLSPQSQLLMNNSAMRSVLNDSRVRSCVGKIKSGLFGSLFNKTTRENCSCRFGPLPRNLVYSEYCEGRESKKQVYDMGKCIASREYRFPQLRQHAPQHCLNPAFSGLPLYTFTTKRVYIRRSVYTLSQQKQN